MYISENDLISFENFDQMRHHLVTVESKHQDIRIRPKEMTYRADDGAMIIKSSDYEGELFFSETGATQFLSKLGIPKSYATAMPNDLMKPHIDHLKDKLEDKPILLRINNDTNVIRACLSGSYGVLNHTDVLGHIEIIGSGTNLEFKALQTDSNGDMLNIRGIFPEMSHIAKDPNGKSNPLYAGFHFKNGETGFHSVGLDFIVFEQWCTNGAVKHIGGTSVLNKSHRGQMELFDETRMAFEAIRRNADEAVASFVEAKDLQLREPEDFLRTYMKQNQSAFRKAFQERVMDQWHARPDTSVYGVGSAITAAARDLHYQERLNVERYAGKLMFERGGVKKGDLRA